MALLSAYKNFKSNRQRKKPIADFKVNDARCLITKSNTNEGPYLEAYLDGSFVCCASYKKNRPEQLGFCIGSLVNDALNLKR